MSTMFASNSSKVQQPLFHETERKIKDKTHQFVYFPLLVITFTQNRCEFIVNSHDAESEAKSQLDNGHIVKWEKVARD